MKGSNDQQINNSEDQIIRETIGLKNIFQSVRSTAIVVLSDLLFLQMRKLEIFIDGNLTESPE